MAEIWIWNSMAKRRRSASDTFLENGLGIIESYLLKRGHQVKLIDQAVPASYDELSPTWLTQLLKNVYRQLFAITSKKSPFKPALGILSLLLQSVLSAMQNQRMKKNLRKIARSVQKNQVRIFGIKLWYGEAFVWSKYLTKKIHQYSPQTIVVAGGYHATLYEQDVLRYSNFDLAICGDGEYVLADLLDRIPENWDKMEYLKLIEQLADHHQINNLIYRKENDVLKSIGEDSRQLCEIDKEKAIPTYKTTHGKANVHILLESSGCPWGKCSFCVHNTFHPRYLKRNVDSIMDEIRNMINQGITMFRFAGSDTPPEFGGIIAQEILKNQFEIAFTMGTRAVKNCQSEIIYRRVVENYSLLIDAGLKAIFIGGECANDLINDKIMNKGLKKEDILYTIKAVREAQRITGKKIKISLAFIYPTPLYAGITHDQVLAENLTFINQAQPDAVMITPPGPFKNSDWNNRKEKYSFQLGKNFIREMIEYEYVLYKPLEMWPDISISLHGDSFKEILQISQNFRNRVETELKIPTDLSDEHFMMMDCIGITSKEDIFSFKKDVMLSLVSCDYSFINMITQKVNDTSALLALKNKDRMVEKQLVNEENFQLP